MACLGRAGALVAAVLLLGATAAQAQHQVVCPGEAAGGYAAFPDACLVASTTAARSPKSNNSHSNEAAEIVPCASLLVLTLRPGTDVFP